MKLRKYLTQLNGLANFQKEHWNTEIKSNFLIHFYLFNIVLSISKISLNNFVIWVEIVLKFQIKLSILIETSWMITQPIRIQKSWLEINNVIYN